MWGCVCVCVHRSEVNTVKFSLCLVKERTSLLLICPSARSLMSAFRKEHRKHPTFIVSLMSGECERLLNVFAEPKQHYVLQLNVLFFFPFLPEAANPLTASYGCWVLFCLCADIQRREAWFMTHCINTPKHNTLHNNLIPWHWLLWAQLVKTPWYCFMCLQCIASCLCFVLLQLDFILWSPLLNHFLLILPPFNRPKIHQTTHVSIKRKSLFKIQLTFYFLQGISVAWGKWFIGKIGSFSDLYC